MEKDFTTLDDLHVSKDQSFKSIFESLDTNWQGKEDDITKVKFNYKEDKYFASLCASYIIFCKTGICSKHFEEADDVPKVVTLIMRYFVYYYMKRFTSQPALMSPFLNSSDLTLVQSLIPTKKVWTSKSDYTKQAISSFLAQKRKEGKEVRNAKYYGSQGYGGVLGIKYKEVTKIINQGPDDWKKFLRSETFGITQRGQLLLQKSIKSYVYSVLGAQVRTRWQIAGSGAKSYQTQTIFHQIVKETVMQGNDAILVSNMRSAIKGSNLVLNLAIMPGIILVPSRLIILDKPIPGYNNVLEIANKSMQFGSNKQLNYSQPVTPQPTTLPSPTTQVPAPLPKPTLQLPKKSYPKYPTCHPSPKTVTNKYF